MSNLNFFQFFLELQHYILTSCVKGDTAKSAVSETANFEDLSLIKSHLQVKSIQALRERDREFASLLGTAFDSVIEAFMSLVKEMEASLVQFVVNSVRSKCYNFKQEK